MSDPLVFVSYRRHGDAAGYAGRVSEALERRFGKTLVFTDVGDIESGQRFDDALERALESCLVFLPVIGPQWLAVTYDDGRRRLDDPTDWVRREAEHALGRGVTIIPLLVGDATMPEAASLPPSLHDLTKAQALELSDSRWDYDVRTLVRRVALIVPEPWWRKLVRLVLPARGIVGRTARALLVGFLVAAIVVAWFRSEFPDAGDAPQLMPAALALGALVAFAIDWTASRLWPRESEE
jgi:hypothetical protein